MFKTIITIYHDTKELDEAKVVVKVVVDNVTDVLSRHQSFYRTMKAEVSGPYPLILPRPVQDIDDAGRA